MHFCRFFANFLYALFHWLFLSNYMHWNDLTDGNSLSLKGFRFGFKVEWFLSSLKIVFHFCNNCNYFPLIWKATSRNSLKLRFHIWFSLNFSISFQIAFSNDLIGKSFLKLMNQICHPQLLKRRSLDLHSMYTIWYIKRYFER